MKKVLCMLTALFALSWASAQTGSSGQGQVGGSSDQSSASSTDQQQTKKSTKKGAKKAGETTLTGCLSGPDAEGNYELQHGSKKVDVSGSDELKQHVGHTVKLHGTWAKASEAGEKEGAEKGEAKSEKGERHFQVSSLEQISETCKGGAATGTGEHKMNHHKKGTEGGGAAQPSASPSPSPSQQ